MKKQNLYAIIVTTIAIILLTIVSILFFNRNRNTVITEEEALNIAFKKANVSSDDVKVLSSNKINNKYEIEFKDNQYEYDLEINLNTGEILEFDKDVIDKNIIKNEESNKNITEKEAKKIALDYLKLKESDATFTKSKLDLENGIMVYELELFTNDTEYEININSNTKEIVKVSKDIIKNSNSVNNSNYIGVEKAKEIVLNHNNINDSVIWKNAEFDFERNIAIYEIEFYYNNIEYSYEINAITGDIIQFEIDKN